MSRIVATIGVAVLLALVLFPLFAQAKPCSKCVSHLSNVKQQGIGMLLYAEDHDRRFTPQDVWMDGVERYVKNPGFFHAPGLPRNAYGYAFNGALDVAKPPEEAANVPMIYDSVNLARNASDLVTSLPHPGRHQGRNMIAYADGHAKAVRTP